MAVAAVGKEAVAVAKKGAVRAEAATAARGKGQQQWDEVKRQQHRKDGGQLRRQAGAAAAMVKEQQ